MRRTRHSRRCHPVAAAILFAAATAFPAGTSTPLHAQAATPRGPLFIVGGGGQPDGLITRFVALAGGPGAARIAVIPLASGEPAESGEGKAEQLREFGAESFVLLTTAAEAGEEATRRRLDGVTGIWFTGGDQARITDALNGTALLEDIRRLNAGGVVIGGTSAGAAIMSPHMLTGSQMLAGEDTIGYHGDTFARIARGTIEVVPGFGLLPGVVVDQHFVRRERHNRLISAVLERPDHVGVGIDESTALEVGADGIWRVRGASVVVVYDARRATVSEPGAPVLGAAGLVLHILTPGSSYDPATGVVTLATRAP